MSRQSRLILVLVVMAGIGVSTLLFVANQYKSALAKRPSARPAVGSVEDSSRLIDGFLAARQAVRTVAARYPGDQKEGPEAKRAWKTERSSALSAYGMTYQDYVAVRSAWRAARLGARVVDPSLAAALRARPAALTEGALDELEDWDDAVK